MSGMLTQSSEILRDEGIVSLLNTARDFVHDLAENNWLKHRYKLQYGDLAPEPNEVLRIDPADLEYGLPTRHLPGDLPNYGVVGGSWDEKKTHWRDMNVWDGLRERFEEKKPWPETFYYRYGMNKLEKGDSIGYLDGPQTMDNFERYLDYLDDLYEDIEHNGYDPSSTIIAHIGRDGEWMVGHGNHRRVIANITEVESVPVRTKYRHEQWQAVRRRFYDATSLEEVCDVAEYRDHPDVPDVSSG